MGMLAYIYKPPYGECSNKGISSRVSEVCVINVEGPFEPSEKAPAVRLTKRPFGNVVCIPVEVEKKWTMFGGCYVDTSDSRFNEAVSALAGYKFGFPVALHDRVE
jgi:hypothetical protein